MFKFLRRNRQSEEQQREPSPPPERNSADVVTDGPQKEDQLEEALKPLFESIIPGLPEDYVVPVTEIERLWLRFQQLGPNDDGTLPYEEIIQRELFTSDPFARQIWRTFPRDEDGNITFYSFVGVLMWWKTAPLEQKLEGIFKLLNRSQPLDVQGLKQIILKLDSSVNEETARSKAELLVKTIDDKLRGFIDADQWMKWVLQLPEDEITKLTNFDILPAEIDSQPPSRSISEPESEPIISDELLVDIAGKIGERDWTPLAHNLGFTKQEIRDVKNNYPNRSREQTYQILLLWKQKMGHAATQAALEQSLRNSGFEAQSSLS